jgi:hypothetical protein
VESVSCVEFPRHKTPVIGKRHRANRARRSAKKRSDQRGFVLTEERAVWPNFRLHGNTLKKGRGWSQSAGKIEFRSQRGSVVARHMVMVLRGAILVVGRVARCIAVLVSSRLLGAVHLGCRLARIFANNPSVESDEDSNQQEQ